MSAEREWFSDAELVLTNRYTGVLRIRLHRNDPQRVTIRLLFQRPTLRIPNIVRNERLPPGNMGRDPQSGVDI
jgi:hypothetical protein